ncbi:MAG: type 4a pilus biogenesis protein PilO [Spiribacter sp.]|nr:type 4a pilus biogenesis protein PilO [Spiribacter sp.]
MAITQPQPPRSRLTMALCGLGALAAGLLAGSWWLFEPARTALADARLQTRDLTETLEAQRDRLASGSTLNETHAQLQARLADSPVFLPGEPDPSATLAALATEAREAELVIERFAPNIAVTNAEDPYVPISATLQGSWAGIVDFLLQLSHQPRLITLRRFDLEPVNQQDVHEGLRLRADLAAHWRPIDTTMPSLIQPPVADQQKATRSDTLAQNPFASAEDQNTPQAASWPHYLGRITHGSRIWALIRDLNGQIHRLQTGDRITPTTPDAPRLQVDQIGATSLRLTAVRSAGAESGTSPIKLPLRKRQSSGACPWPCPDR